jgi:hypothetical protein
VRAALRSSQALFGVVYACARAAVLVAEIVAHFFPRMIELHNYRFGAWPAGCAGLRCSNGR